MDAAVAPPQPSLLDKVGDVLTGLKKGILGQGIPLDSSVRAVAPSTEDVETAPVKIATPHY